jgi:DNA repair ATPase RecN
MKKTTSTNVFFKRGKMVFCLKTHQIFPSVQVAAKELDISHHMAYKILEGKHVNNRGLFYVETMSDIDKIFSDYNTRVKAEAEAKAKAEMELAALDEEFARIEQLKAELRKKQAELKKKLH